MCANLSLVTFKINIYFAGIGFTNMSNITVVYITRSTDRFSFQLSIVLITFYDKIFHKFPQDSCIQKDNIFLLLQLSQYYNIMIYMKPDKV